MQFYSGEAFRIVYLDGTKYDCCRVVFEGASSGRSITTTIRRVGHCGIGPIEELDDDPSFARFCDVMRRDPAGLTASAGAAK